MNNRNDTLNFITSTKTSALLVGVAQELIAQRANVLDQLIPKPTVPGGNFCPTKESLNHAIARVSKESPARFIVLVDGVLYTLWEPVGWLRLALVLHKCARLTFIGSANFAPSYSNGLQFLHQLLHAAE